jgi:hypothetical protein
MTPDITRELAAETGFEAEYWQTGGGVMCNAVVLERDQTGYATRYILVSAEDTWVAGVYEDIAGDSDEGILFLSSLSLERTPTRMPASGQEVAEWLAGLLRRLRVTREEEVAA